MRLNFVITAQTNPFDSTYVEFMTKLFWNLGFYETSQLRFGGNSQTTLTRFCPLLTTYLHPIDIGGGIHIQL